MADLLESVMTQATEVAIDPNSGKRIKEGQAVMKVNELKVPVNSSGLLRGKISSDVDHLEILHQTYPWLPGAESIRPDPQTRQKKLDFSKSIEENWCSFEDFFLYYVFGKSFLLDSDVGKKYVLENDVEKRQVFKANDFRYDVGNGEHWVLWYGSRVNLRTDDEITHDIEIQLAMMLGATVPFQFGWYINPQVTIPEFFHVQVFWVGFK